MSSTPTGTKTTTTGTGLLFGPGLDAADSVVRFSATGLGLELHGSHASVVVPPWSRVTWRQGGFNDTQLLLEWLTDTGTFTLAVGDAESQTVLRAHLPRASQANLAPPRATITASTTILLLILCVPVILIGLLVWQADNLIDWAVSKIPIETEIFLGRQAFAQQRQGLQIVEDHPALPMVRQIGTHLTPGSAYPYEFHIARDGAINAFAMPGGFIVIHTGLLASADSAEELAGVIAHEVQHVELRHGLRGLVHAAGWRVILSLILGDTSGSLAGSWVADLGTLSFSRSQETAADLKGVEALVGADIDPNGLVAFFGKLARDPGRLPPFLSSHPANAERLKTVKAAFPKERFYRPLPYDYAHLRGLPN